MQFLLLICDDEKRWTKLGKPDYGSELDEYRAFGREFAGKIRGGNALPPTMTAKTVRVREGKPLASDGPFAETKEQLGGYYWWRQAMRTKRSGSRLESPGRGADRLKSGRSSHFPSGRCRFPGRRTSSL